MKFSRRKIFVSVFHDHDHLFLVLMILFSFVLIQRISTEEIRIEFETFNETEFGHNSDHDEKPQRKINASESELSLSTNKNETATTTTPSTTPSPSKGSKKQLKRLPAVPMPQWHHPHGPSVDYYRQTHIPHHVPPPPPLSPPPPFSSHYHYHGPRPRVLLPTPRSLFSRQPHIHVIKHQPLQVDELSHAGKKLMRNLVHGVNHVVKRVLHSGPRERSSSGLVKYMNSDNLLASASKWLPRINKSKILAPLSSRSSSMEGSGSIRRDYYEQASDSSRESNLNNNKTIYNQTNGVNSQQQKQFYNDTTHPHNQYIHQQQHHQQQSIGNKYEKEGNKLRQDIIEKVSNLQTILMTASEVSKQRRDIILGRILRQTNNRLERAKLRADQILSEPSTSEIAVKTLRTINQGINNINMFLESLLQRRINIPLIDLKERDEKAVTEEPITSQKESQTDAEQPSPSERIEDFEEGYN